MQSQAGATSALMPPDRVVNAISSGDSDAEAAVQDCVRRGKCRVQYDVTGCGRRARYRGGYRQPIQRGEEGWRKIRGRSMIRALLIVVAVSCTEVGRVAIQRTIHMIAVALHVRRCCHRDGNWVNLWPARTRVCRDRDLCENNHRDEQSADALASEAFHFVGAGGVRSGTGWSKRFEFTLAKRAADESCNLFHDKLTGDKRGLTVSSV